jgi:uncharacterized protein (TIGR03435 family)
MPSIRRGVSVVQFAFLALALPVSATQLPLTTKPAFEVASIRRAGGGNPELERRGGTRFTPTGFMATGVPLVTLIQIAYDLKPFQLAGAPGWAGTEQYDVQARATQPTDDRGIRAMLRTLLEDRFKLKLHRETRTLPFYALEVARKSDRLREVESEETPQARISMFPNGSEMFMRLTGEQTTMAQVSDVLTAVLLASGRPVIDRTGLRGRYIFTLDWAPDPPPATGTAAAASLPSGPTLQTAIREQLGLRLSEEKGPLDVLVIEGVERPTEN